MSDNPDVTVLIPGEARDEICRALAHAEHTLVYGEGDQEHDALRELVELVGDLQIGSETSNFVFPIPDEEPT